MKKLREQEGGYLSDKIPRSKLEHVARPNTEIGMTEEKIKAILRENRP